MYTQRMNRPSARTWDWSSGLLLFLLIQVAAARLVTTSWADYLYYAEVLAAYGAILGLALGACRYAGRILLWFVLDYTLVIVPWQMTGAATSGQLAPDRFLNIGGILLNSTNQFIQRQPVKDSIFFVAVVSLVFWIFAISAGYLLIRKSNVLAAILPWGAAILLIQVYDNNNPRASWWLAVFILVALLLIGRHYFLQNRKEWIQKRVFLSGEAWPNIFGGLLTTVGLAVVIAWLIPTSFSSIQAVTDSWNSFYAPIRDRLSNAVTSLNSSSAFGAGGYYYGDSLALGRDASQGDTTVFTVQVLSSPEFTPRYYWRGRVYDVYSHGAWVDAPTPHLNFQPLDSYLKIPNADGRRYGEYEFTFQVPSQSLLYSPSQPVWVNKPGRIEVIPTGINIYDVLAWNAAPPIAMGNRYQVYASIAYPNILQLRSAGSDYPQGIKDRYLGIPEDVRPDVQALAEKITAVQNTPYDKAEAITNYLRSNLEYSSSVAEPPAGIDPIVWVLFTYKKAFCNYYASAEVLMLRSIGIPARLAVGFAQGQYQNGTYDVRVHDAHAWPEVYFPNVGWIEFEPTASQDALARPESGIQANSTAPTSAPAQKKLGEGDQNQPSAVIGTAGSIGAFTLPSPRNLLIGLLLPGALVIIFVLVRYRVINRMPFYLTKTLERNGIQVPLWLENWRRWTELVPVERSFASINLSLYWLGKAQPIDATAAERAALLKKLMPAASSHIEALTTELESALFTPGPSNLPRARAAGFMVLLHTLRRLLLNIFGVKDTVQYT
jgi:transglutaminase-like putative cysteine protease